MIPRTTKFSNFTTYSGCNSKMLLLKDITLSDFKFDYKINSVCEFFNRKGYRNYTYFKTWCDALEYLPYYEGKRFIYEMIRSNKPCRPYLDIEKTFDCEPDAKFKKELINTLCQEIVIIFKTDYGLDIADSDIYITDSSDSKDGKYKVSYHFTISTKEKQLLYETNRKGYDGSAFHLAKRLCDNLGEFKEYIDLSVYSLDRCMRIINSYKTPKDLRQLVPLNYKGNPLDYIITAYDLNQPYQYIKVPYAFDIQKAIKVQKREANSLADKCPVNIDIQPNNREVRKLLTMMRENIHQSCYFTNFKIIGEENQRIYSFNYQDRDEQCPISGATAQHDALGFYAFLNEFGQVVVKCRSQKCDKQVITLDYLYEDPCLFKNSHITVCVDYLTSTDTVMKPKGIAFELANKDPVLGDQNKILTLMQKWYVDEAIKSIAFKSQMGTGKTVLLSKLLNHYKFKRILWITHRQTLTNSLIETFKLLGFESYLDCAHINTIDKVIIQVDSLHKLLNDSRIPKYDLIIIDEIESNLNHFNSATIIHMRETIFELLKVIVTDSTKIIALDADFDNRAYTYLSYFGQVQVIVNTKIKNIRHFKWTSDKDYYIYKILADLKQGFNIVIASMSAGFLDELEEELIKANYKYTKHSGKSDDSLKNNLKDVNTYWQQFQCVLYSPSIEAGVDFSAVHFDKLYSVISARSCSPRSFLQMTGRVRTLKDNNVLTLIDTRGIHIQKFSPSYTFSDAQNYMKYIYKGSDLRSKVIDGPEGVKFFGKDIDGLYAKILMYNLVEENSAKRNHFIPTLIKLCRSKEFTFQEAIVDSEYTLPHKTNKDIKKTAKEHILSAEDINEDELQVLLEKKNRNISSEADKFKIEKYMIKQFWGLQELTKEFLNDFYQKEYVLTNLNALIDLKTFKCEDNIKHSEMKLKCAIIDDLIRLLGFANDIDGQAVIKSDHLEANIKKVISDSLLFKDFNKHRLLFGMDKVKTNTYLKWDKKKCLISLNNILDSFGLRINYVKIRERIKKKLLLLIYMY